MNQSLTKSLYTRGLQCKKSLWLKLNDGNVLKQPDDSALSVFSTGSAVGSLACELFPGGNKISYDNLNNLKEQYFIQVNQDTVATFLNNSVPHS